MSRGRASSGRVAGDLLPPRSGFTRRGHPQIAPLRPADRLTTLRNVTSHLWHCGSKPRGARETRVGRYTFLEDVALADCAVEIEAKDPEDLFETAAAVLAALMVDPGT